MAYTGDVTVGGPPDTRELPGLTVTKLAVGPMDNNAYLLTCTETGEAAHEGQESDGPPDGQAIPGESRADAERRRRRRGRRGGRRNRRGREGEAGAGPNGHDGEAHAVLDIKTGWRPY